LFIFDSFAKTASVLLVSVTGKLLPENCKKFVKSLIYLSLVELFVRIFGK